MSVRTVLVDTLRAICLATDGLEDVRVIPSVREIGEISKPTLIVKTDSYSKVTAAPHTIQGNFTLILVSKHQNIDRAEDELEDLLEALLPRLFTWGLMFESATQTGYDESHLAFDITLTSILS